MKTNKQIIQLKEKISERIKNMEKKYTSVKVFFILIFFSMIIANSSCSQSTVNYKTEQIIQNIPCVGDVKYFNDKKIQMCFLSKDFKIDGYILPTGTKLFFNNNGKMNRCIISKATEFLGQSFPAKTNIFFNNWGEELSFWLPERTKIQGYLLDARDDGPGIPLYPNGKLKQIWLMNDTLIEGVPCTTSGNFFTYGWHVVKLGTERMVKFYDNGHLKQALLYKDVIIQGHGYKKGELIYFDKNEKIDLSGKN